MAKEVIIGIDLGTTNSEAAYLEGGRPVIIPSAEGSTFGGKMFPSVVAFTKDGERIVGDPAKRQAVLNPENTIMHIKRKMGTKHRVTIKKKKYSPEEYRPGIDINDDEEIVKAGSDYTQTIFHPVGTCKMGQDDMAVVDEKLIVRGIKNLRVIDASIMPNITSGNTNAPTIMIAEKGADMIMRDV